MSDTDDMDAMGAAMAAAVLDADTRDSSRSSVPSATNSDTSAPPDGPSNSAATNHGKPSSGPPSPPDADTPRRSRTAAKLVPAFETAEGVGARVKRSIGTPGLWNLSPFLIFDYARVRPGEGFPDHAHRGMSTLSYVLEGMLEHEDFLGNRGRLAAGDVQWMTAGRGMMHSEMPYFDPEHPVDTVALQLWIDLPAGKKMVKPSYKDKKAAQLARAAFPGGEVVVVSGESHGAVGPIRPLAGCWFLDYRMEAGAETFQEVPGGWTAFVYVLEGSVAVGEEGTQVEPHTCCVLSSAPNETGVRLRTGTRARFILVAGQPLDQPVILQGPFVVTSKDAAVQALRDFQSGRNGFEKAVGWQSEIGKAAGAGGVRRKKGNAKGRRGGGGGDGEWEERDASEKGRGRGKKEKEENEGEPAEKGRKGAGKRR